MPKAIQAYIGYDGRVSIENANTLPQKRDPKRKRSSSSVKSLNSLSRYHESAASQLPQWPCYSFNLNDKGWRVELEVWTEECEEGHEQSNNIKVNKSQQQYRTFLQLETPLTA